VLYNITPTNPCESKSWHNFYASSETVQEYCKRSREVASELMRGISESLGLEESYMQKRFDFELGSQLLIVNIHDILL